jgi:hypothetical protein
MDAGPELRAGEVFRAPFGLADLPTGHPASPPTSVSPWASGR